MENLPDFYNRGELSQRAHREQIMKGLYGDDIFKAEGSKGGKIIGHTQSGKPIYENADHPSHQDFSDQDHIDAQKYALKERLKITGRAPSSKERSNYNKFVSLHNEASKRSKKD